MVFWLLPMVYRPPYWWYIEHPTHGTLTPYQWYIYIDPPIHSILIPYPWYIDPPPSMVYQTPYPWYVDPLPISWLEMRGSNYHTGGSKYHMTPVLSSFMNYHRMCNQINMTSTTSGAGTAYLSRAPKFSPGFQWGLCYTIVSFMCMLCRSLFVILSFFAIVLSILRFTDSYYPFWLWYLETLLKKSCYSFPNRLLVKNCHVSGS